MLESPTIKHQLVFVYNVFSVVVTTVWTNSVRKLRLMTLRTNWKSRSAHLHIRRLSASSLCFWCFPLRYCHCRHLLITLSDFVYLRVTTINYSFAHAYCQAFSRLFYNYPSAVVGTVPNWLTGHQIIHVRGQYVHLKHPGIQPGFVDIIHKRQSVPFVSLGFPQNFPTSLAETQYPQVFRRPIL